MYHRIFFQRYTCFFQRLAEVYPQYQLGFFVYSVAGVFIVDDDPAVLKALARLLRSEGLGVKTFSSAEEFLKEHDPSAPGCLLLDAGNIGRLILRFEKQVREQLFVFFFEFTQS